MGKDTLPKSIEDITRMQVFYRMLEDIKARNAGADPEELQLVIDLAVNEVRRIGRAKA